MAGRVLYCSRWCASFDTLVMLAYIHQFSQTAHTPNKQTKQWASCLDMCSWSATQHQREGSVNTECSRIAVRAQSELWQISNGAGNNNVAVYTTVRQNFTELLPYTVVDACSDNRRRWRHRRSITFSWWQEWPWHHSILMSGPPFETQNVYAKQLNPLQCNASVKSCHTTELRQIDRHCVKGFNKRTACPDKTLKQPVKSGLSNTTGIPCNCAGMVSSVFEGF